MKWAMTSMTRYPIDINATTLVYLRESRRRRNDSGITISLVSKQLALAQRRKHGSSAVLT